MAVSRERYEYWQRHVEQWQQSGLTQSAYCARHGVCKVGLSRWQRKFAEEARPAMPITLVPAVQLAALRPAISQPLVLRGSRWQLELPADTSATWLSDLLGQLP